MQKSFVLNHKPLPSISNIILKQLQYKNMFRGSKLQCRGKLDGTYSPLDAIIRFLQHQDAGFTTEGFKRKDYPSRVPQVAPIYTF